MSAESRWNVIASTPRSARARPVAADPGRNPARVLSAIALASMAAGAINIAAAATIGRGSAQNLGFFVVVAAAQLTWAAVALARAPRWWLALGAAGNLVVAATWVVSRTVGLPAGADAGIVLPIRFPDTLATALEVMVAAGAVALMVRGSGLTRSAARSVRVTIAAAVVAGALTLGGVLSQAGTFASSPAVSHHNGPGVSGPSAPGTGNGAHTSGGGTSGGGSYGY
jgi:hypothetical protein